MSNRCSRGFAHHRLDAYAVALELAEGVVHLTRCLPRGYADMRDQLHRSALSVVRNIAEAASRTTPADRRARFTVARGECAECDATLEVALRLGILPSGRVEAMRVLADRVGAMLTGLLRKETARQASREPAPSSSGM